MLLLQKRFIINAEQFLMRKSYSYRTDLLQMLSKLFLLRKRFVTFVEEYNVQRTTICYKY